MSGEAFAKLDEKLMEIELGVRAIDFLATITVQAHDPLERERSGLCIQWVAERLLPMINEAAHFAEDHSRGRGAGT
ncbi:hypothetical protein [Roseomonas indoligenes]|uniref:Uncharacterized protein n=1 Tax=Roseomonas indoligenes TaxID=2820811 RepID=A0A940MZM6_9PROT|nr:hypothetical protein [Pararoseomonas indoligenes]MBP0493995.1 hypothetical protein [Pararoseomonas indoligenes]